MRQNWKVICIIFLLGCKTQANKIEEIDNIIHLSKAIENTQEAHLSDIADSISFVILETKNGSLLANRPSFTFSTNFIFAGSHCFNWNGEFKKLIGQRGNGPCEDPGEIIGQVLYQDDHFYSKGMKLIEYDSIGNCTGKEKFIYGLKDKSSVYGMFNSADFALARNNFMLYKYPDTIFFLNKDFQFISSRQVLKSFPLQKSYLNPLGGPFATSYGDTTVFYNFFNDTIFHVGEFDVIPKWVVDLKIEDRVSIDFLVRHGELFRGAFTASKNGNLDECELVKMTDNKLYVRRVYETDRYVFLIWSKMLQFAERRKKERVLPQIAYYDKNTGKTLAVKGNGFIDDFYRMDKFFPYCGAFSNKMITYFWPHELQDYIDDCRSKGKEVHPKITKLMQKIQPEDNPVLFIVHLKK